MLLDSDEEYAKVDRTLWDKYHEQFGSVGLIQAPSDLTADRLNRLMREALNASVEIDFEKEGWYIPPDGVLV